MGRDEIDWRRRYPPNWNQTCAKAHQSVNGTCCLCRQKPSEEVHHVRYSTPGLFRKRPITGRERIGVDIFPVDKECHKRLHQNDAWIEDRRDPLWGNHQAPEWERKLRGGYARLTGSGTWLFPRIVLAAILLVIAFHMQSVVMWIVLGAIAIALVCSR